VEVNQGARCRKNPEGIQLFFQDATNNIRHAKTQEWTATREGLIAIAALVRSMRFGQRGDTSWSRQCGWPPSPAAFSCTVSHDGSVDPGSGYDGFTGVLAELCPTDMNGPQFTLGRAVI
jgi:hypothetical protein